MKTPTYEDYKANPTYVLMSVEQAARKARAEAVRQYIVVPVKWLFARIASKPAVLQTRSA